MLNSFSCFCSRKGLISFLFTVSVIHICNAYGPYSPHYCLPFSHSHCPLYPPSPACVCVCVQDLFCSLTLFSSRPKAETDTKRLCSLKLGQREQHLLKSRELRTQIADVEQGHDRLYQSCCDDRQASLNKGQAVSRLLPVEE